MPQSHTHTHTQAHTHKNINTNTHMKTQAHKQPKICQLLYKLLEKHPLSRFLHFFLFLKNGAFQELFYLKTST